MSSNPIQYAGLLWNVEYDYSPPKRGVHTLRNGDPGYPDDPEEISINFVSIETDPNNILEFLSPATLEGLEEEISSLEACSRDESRESLQDSYEEIEAWDRKERS